MITDAVTLIKTDSQLFLSMIKGKQQNAMRDATEKMHEAISFYKDGEDRKGDKTYHDYLEKWARAEAFREISRDFEKMIKKWN